MAEENYLYFIERTKEHRPKIFIIPKNTYLSTTHGIHKAEGILITEEPIPREKRNLLEGGLQSIIDSKGTKYLDFRKYQSG